MLGAVRPFWVEPPAGGGVVVPPVPGVVPGEFPKLELPRGSAGSSSLQAEAPRRVKRAMRVKVLEEAVSVQPP
jgi:hypothetical protein